MNGKIKRAAGRGVYATLLGVMIAAGMAYGAAAQESALPAQIQSRVEAIVRIANGVVAADEIQLLVEQHPEYAAEISAEAARLRPGTAVRSASAATRAVPESAPAIAAGAARGAPGAAASIAAAVAVRTRPELANDVCAAVAIVVPAAAGEVAKAVVAAVPYSADVDCASAAGIVTAGRAKIAPPPRVRRILKGTLENPNVVSPSG